MVKQRTSDDARKNRTARATCSLSLSLPLSVSLSLARSRTTLTATTAFGVPAGVHAVPARPVHSGAHPRGSVEPCDPYHHRSFEPHDPYHHRSVEPRDPSHHRSFEPRDPSPHTRPPSVVRRAVPLPMEVLQMNWTRPEHITSTRHADTVPYRVSCVVCRASCVVCRVSCVVCRISYLARVARRRRRWSTRPASAAACSRSPRSRRSRAPRCCSPRRWGIGVCSVIERNWNGA